MKNVILLLIILSIAILCNAQPPITIEGSFAIKNMETGLYLRPKGASSADNIQMVLYTPKEWKCMTWNFIKKEENTYFVENLYTGKTFEADDNNRKVVQKTIQSSNPKQIWEFIMLEENKYLIKASETNLYLTASNNSGNINTEIKLTGEQNNKLNYWTLVQQDPEF